MTSRVVIRGGGVRGPAGADGIDGLPGVNAVPADSAVAGYISTPGTSATKTALSASIAEDVEDEGSDLRAAFDSVFGPGGAAGNLGTNEGDARYPLKSSIFDAVKTRLDNGQSVAMSYLTDSTGNDPTTEHIGLVAARLATLYPTHRVEFRGYDNGAPNNYTGALSVVKQAGPTTERKVTFAGTANSGLKYGASSVSAITGDLDVRFRASATAWDASAQRVIAAKAAGAGARAWWIYLDNTGITLVYSTDGTTLLTKGITHAALNGGSGVLAPGSTQRIRVVLDVDNGASGHDVKFYTSTDGITWTQRGSTITTAGTIALFSDTVTPLNICGRQDGATGGWVGDIYRVEIRSGIDGAIVAPTLPDLWSFGQSTFDGVFSGDPVIQVWAGAASGWGLGPFQTNAARLIPAVGQVLHLMGTAHNDPLKDAVSLWGAWDSLLATARLRAPAAAFGVFNENPERAPQTAAQIASHADRCRAIGTYAASRGYEFYDVYKAFTTSASPIADLVQTDGVHPTDLGSQLWAKTVLDRWGIGLS